MTQNDMLPVKKTNVDPKIIAIVKKYLANVEENNMRVQEAYIFGSQVTGDTHESSDIDVCVVSSDFHHPFEDGVALAKIAAQDDETLNIEPHIVTSEDFANPYSHFTYTVKQTGVQVSLS